MSEDEVKAIKTIKEDIEAYKEKGAWKENSILVKSLRIVLNLIENQQKEICRLQNIKRKDIQDLINNENVNIYKNYISKDKIRDMQRYREFELQQEYKEFEDDIEWQTYNKILEEE